AATQRVRTVRKPGTIEAAAEQGQPLVDRDVIAFEAAVADQEGGAGERSDAAADEVSFHLRDPGQLTNGRSGAIAAPDPALPGMCQDLRFRRLIWLNRRIRSR